MNSRFFGPTENRKGLEEAMLWKYGQRSSPRSMGNRLFVGKGLRFGGR